MSSETTRFTPPVFKLFETTTRAGNLSPNFTDYETFEEYPIISGVEVESHYLPTLFVVESVIKSTLIIIGIFGNLTAFLVWIRKRMRHSSGCFLSALALNDLIVVLLMAVLLFHMRFDVGLLNAKVVCEGFAVLFLACQHCNPLLVLGFTVERWIAICFPFHRDRLCTLRNAIISSIMMFGFCLALHGIQAHFWVFDGQICRFRQEDVDTTLWTAWTWTTEAFVFGLVPLLVLIFNIMVLREHHRLMGTGVVDYLQRKHRNARSATTFMLLSVSFVLICTTIPVTCVYALGLTIPTGPTNMTLEEAIGDPTWKSYLTYTTVKRIVDMIGSAHYACNIFIYLATGRIFRFELKCIIIRCRYLRNPEKYYEIVNTGANVFRRSSSQKAQRGRLLSMRFSNTGRSTFSTGITEMTELKPVTVTPETAPSLYKGTRRGTVALLDVGNGEMKSMLGSNGNGVISEE